MRNRIGAALVAALFVGIATPAPAAVRIVAHQMSGLAPRARTVGAPIRPWVEGVTPSLENRVFDATYKTLPNHNVLKVYVFDTTGYESAGIRFSARVPHEQRDLTRTELVREASSLVRTTFDQFPELEALDVWATIPVAKSQATRVESTLFSVSADRETYDTIRDKQLSDAEFLAAFGRIWIAPTVPE